MLTRSVTFDGTFSPQEPDRGHNLSQGSSAHRRRSHALDLRHVQDRETLDQIRAGMDEHAVLVFRGQALTDDDQLAFAQRFDGALHSKTGLSALGKNRLGNEALTDISNVDENGAIRKSEDRMRMFSLGNRLWHTDASFQDPPGRYSMLSARVIPPVSADTEFADMRAAYDALDAEMKSQIEGFHVHHSIAHSRQVLGFELAPEEQDQLKGAVHPLVRYEPTLTTPLALHRGACGAHHGMAGARGPAAATRPDGACDPAPVRLRSCMAQR